MRIITLLFFVFFTAILFAQDRNEIIQQRIEFISEQLETESIDFATLQHQKIYR